VLFGTSQSMLRWQDRAAEAMISASIKVCSEDRICFSASECLRLTMLYRHKTWRVRLKAADSNQYGSRSILTSRSAAGLLIQAAATYLKNTGILTTCL